MKQATLENFALKGNLYSQWDAVSTFRLFWKLDDDEWSGPLINVPSGRKWAKFRPRILLIENSASIDSRNKYCEFWKFWQTGWHRLHRWTDFPDNEARPMSLPTLHYQLWWRCLQLLFSPQIGEIGNQINGVGCRRSCGKNHFWNCEKLRLKVSSLLEDTNFEIGNQSSEYQSISLSLSTLHNVLFVHWKTNIFVKQHHHWIFEWRILDWLRGRTTGCKRRWK